MIFIKNFEEFGHVSGKLLIFLFILINIYACKYANSKSYNFLNDF